MDLVDVGCHSGGESAQHLFVDCSFTKFIFAALGNIYHFEMSISDGSIVEFLEFWAIHNSTHYYIPYFVFWCVWNARNKSIF